MKQLAPSTISCATEFQLSNGEVHFLWWFIQGSIMFPFTRERLRRAWGFCERHAWGAISVEAAFRSGFLHGPAILYEDIMERALACFDVQRPMKSRRLWKRLRQKGACMMCEEGYGPDSSGIARAEIMKTGNDLTELRTFARRTMPYWEKAVCGICAGNASRQRCRIHLIQGSHGELIDDVSLHQELVHDIVRHLRTYSPSFQLEYKGTDTEEDQAALVSAAGWCSGWQLFLSIIE